MSLHPTLHPTDHLAMYVPAQRWQDLLLLSKWCRQMLTHWLCTTNAWSLCRMSRHGLVGLSPQHEPTFLLWAFVKKCNETHLMDKLFQNSCRWSNVCTRYQTKRDREYECAWAGSSSQCKEHPGTRSKTGSRTWPNATMEKRGYLTKRIRERCKVMS